MLQTDYEIQVLTYHDHITDRLTEAKLCVNKRLLDLSTTSLFIFFGK